MSLWSLKMLQDQKQWWGDLESLITKGLLVPLGKKMSMGTWAFFLLLNAFPALYLN